MRMKFNWITMSLASALFVFALISCDLEVPSSVRIKSQPGLYLSLGSPFAGSDMSFSEYLSVDVLKEQLGGKGGNIDILEWEVSPDSDLQAYRVRYPVADININLSQYVESMDVASNLEGVSGGWIPGTGSEIEIVLPLDSMSFAKEVTKVKIGVTLTFYDGGGSFTPPVADEAGSNTVPNDVTVMFKGEVFNNSSQPDPVNNRWESPEIDEFKPVDDKISIGVTVPVGTWFSPRLSFEWEQATIRLDAEEQTGSYALDFSSFKGFMGEGISFKEVTGYMYLKEPDSGQLTADAEVWLEWTKQTGIEKNEVETIDAVITNWKAGFTPPDQDKKIDLTELFTYPLEFHYKLTLNEVTIQNEANLNGRISVDMVILLPLEFTLDDSLASSFEGYKQLKLEALQGLDEDKDLLGRTGESDEDAMFDNLESAKILITNYTNTIISGLAFGIKVKDRKEVLGSELEDVGFGEIEFLGSDLAYPFNPKFELLVPDGSTLRILKPKEEEDTEIDFTIAVQAKTDLDYQVKF